MATETLKLTGKYQTPDRIAEVEYRRTDPAGGRMDGDEETYYEVLVDGELVGTIESITYEGHTTYAGSRIRRDLGTRKEWTWRSADGKRRCPATLWEATRRDAVAAMLGFYRGKKV
jgi:hypothetical protein